MYVYFIQHWLFIKLIMQNIFWTVAKLWQCSQDQRRRTVRSSYNLLHFTTCLMCILGCYTVYWWSGPVAQWLRLQSVANSTLYCHVQGVLKRHLKGDRFTKIIAQKLMKLLPSVWPVPYWTYGTMSWEWQDSKVTNDIFRSKGKAKAVL